MHNNVLKIKSWIINFLNSCTCFLLSDPEYLNTWGGSKIQDMDFHCSDHFNLTKPWFERVAVGGKFTAGGLVAAWPALRTPLSWALTMFPVSPSNKKRVSDTVWAGCGALQEACKKKKSIFCHVSSLCTPCGCLTCTEEIILSTSKPPNPEDQLWPVELLNWSSGPATPIRGN